MFLCIFRIYYIGEWEIRDISSTRGRVVVYVVAAEIRKRADVDGLSLRARVSIPRDESCKKDQFGRTRGGVADWLAGWVDGWVQRGIYLVGAR